MSEDFPQSDPYSRREPKHSSTFASLEERLVDDRHI